jgi:hypothetical protein
MAAALDFTCEHDEKSSGRAYRNAAWLLSIGMTMNDKQTKAAGIDGAETLCRPFESISSEATSPNEPSPEGGRALDLRDCPPFQERRASGKPKGEVLRNGSVGDPERAIVSPNVVDPFFSKSLIAGIVGLDVQADG